MESLCQDCLHMRQIVSARGSVFLLCQLSQTDVRFPKYPPQPVVRCEGYDSRRRGLQDLSLELLAGNYAVCRLEPDAAVPAWAGGALLSLTRTPDELSIVCLDEGLPEGIRSERGWRCLRVPGPLDFALVGVVARLSGVLAAAGVSLFVVSTFDTDYLLVKQADLQRASQAVTAAGHTIRDATF